MIGEGTERKVIKAIVQAIVESLKDLDLDDEEELAEKMEKLELKPQHHQKKIKLSLYYVIII